jgi:hypothetical protein
MNFDESTTRTLPSQLKQQHQPILCLLTTTSSLVVLVSCVCELMLGVTHSVVIVSVAICASHLQHNAQ